MDDFRERLENICQQVKAHALAELERPSMWERKYRDGKWYESYFARDSEQADSPHQHRAFRMNLRFEAARLAGQCGSLEELEKLAESLYLKKFTKNHQCMHHSFLYMTVLEILRLMLLETVEEYRPPCSYGQMTADGQDRYDSEWAGIHGFMAIRLHPIRDRIMANLDLKQKPPSPIEAMVAAAVVESGAGASVEEVEF